MLVVAIILVGLLAIRIAIQKLVDHFKKKRAITVIPSVAPQNGLNTVKNNPEVMNRVITFVGFFITVLVCIPKMVFDMDSTVRPELTLRKQLIVDLVPHIALSFCAPLIIFCRNAALRKFARNSLQC